MCFCNGIYRIFHIWNALDYIFLHLWSSLGTKNLGQITSGFAHLTQSLGHELNGQSHWLFGPGGG